MRYKELVSIVSLEMRAVLNELVHTRDIFQLLRFESTMGRLSQDILSINDNIAKMQP